jgi:Family of unknown function (DUF6884)
MKELCIIPCGKKKIWDKNPDAGPTKARYVYIGNYASKCREYAERFYPDSWCILSAKYGFLFPDDIIPGPYNVTFNDKKTNPVTIEELRQQIKSKRLDSYDKYIVIGGKNYVDIVEILFHNKNLQYPLANSKGMAFAIKKMAEAIKKDLPI